MKQTTLFKQTNKQTIYHATLKSLWHFLSRLVSAYGFVQTVDEHNTIVTSHMYWALDRST